MATAKEMRAKAEAAMHENVLSLIESEAEKGRRSVDLSDYDDLYLTADITADLEEKGYELSGQEIRW